MASFYIILACSLLLVAGANASCFQMRSKSWPRHLQNINLQLIAGKCDGWLGVVTKGQMDYNNACARATSARIRTGRHGPTQRNGVCFIYYEFFIQTGVINNEMMDSSNKGRPNNVHSCEINKLWQITKSWIWNKKLDWSEIHQSITLRLVNPV